MFNLHYDTQIHRKADLKKMMKKTPGVAVAVDNYCALEIIDKTYRIISSRSSANAYKVYWKSNKYFQEIIDKSKEYKELKELIRK
ncbi:MAG: hypothetical protein WC831_04880 [Parcubacteria group bacterium]|jgi:hypothetical protein